MEVKNLERDVVDPGTVLTQSDAVAGATEVLAGCRQVTVIGRLELQARRVPDERAQSVLATRWFQKQYNIV